MADDGRQHSPAWRGWFEDITATLNSLRASKGVVDGSSAAAGVVGELLQSVNGVPVAGGAGVTVNAAILSLTAGDWDVRAEAWCNITGNASQHCRGHQHDIRRPALAERQHGEHVRRSGCIRQAAVAWWSGRAA
jgi:hypothetical protein